MSIIVTGCAGFIGYHLCDRLLSTGHPVVGIDSLNDYYSVGRKRDRLKRLIDHEGFEFFEGLVEDDAFVDRVFEERTFRTVVHLADDQMLFVLDQLAFSDRAEHKVEAHFNVGHEMSVCVDREGGVTITAPSRRSCRLVQVCGQPSNLEQVPQPLDPFWRNYLMDYDIPPQDLEAMDQVDLRFKFGLAANYSSESLWAMLPANIDELNHLSSESGLYFWYNSPGKGLRLVVAPNQWGQAEALLGPELPARPETIYVAGGSPGATIQLALEPRAGDRWVAVLNAGDAYQANEAGIVSI